MVVGSRATLRTNATAHGSTRTHRREAPASSARGGRSSPEVTGPSPPLYGTSVVCTARRLPDGASGRRPARGRRTGRATTVVGGGPGPRGARDRGVPGWRVRGRSVPSVVTGRTVADGPAGGRRTGVPARGDTRVGGGPAGAAVPPGGGHRVPHRPQRPQLPCGRGQHGSGPDAPPVPTDRPLPTTARGRHTWDQGTGPSSGIAAEGDVTCGTVIGRKPSGCWAGPSRRRCAARAGAPTGRCCSAGHAGRSTRWLRPPPRSTRPT